MAFDENPDEVFGGEPEVESGGNGDEKSNRTFLYMALGLGAIGVLSVIILVIALGGLMGRRAETDAYNQGVQATNTAIAVMAAITPTPLPTDTQVPTNTAVPPTRIATAQPTAVAMINDVVAGLSSGNYKTLTSLLEQAGLIEALKGQGPFTLFAPTDDAFAQLSDETLETLSKDPEKLAALLKYHVVEGAVKAADIAKLNDAKTWEGQPITVTVTGGLVTINDAKVTKPDVETANGMIHAIDKVLVPPELRDTVIAQVPPSTSSAKPVGTAVAQVQGTAAANATAKPATSKGTTVPKTVPAKGAATIVPTRVPPVVGTATAAAAALATASASGSLTSTQPISGTAGTGGPMPASGAGEDFLVWLLAAVALVAVVIVARRLRTAHN
jgi:uncharacterized surface protein with fasciclin (FAS1) repeats